GGRTGGAARTWAACTGTAGGRGAVAVRCGRRSTLQRTAFEEDPAIDLDVVRVEGLGVLLLADETAGRVHHHLDAVAGQVVLEQGHCRLIVTAVVADAQLAVGLVGRVAAALFEEHLVHGVRAGTGAAA